MALPSPHPLLTQIRRPKSNNPILLIFQQLRSLTLSNTEIADITELQRAPPDCRITLGEMKSAAEPASDTSEKAP